MAKVRCRHCAKRRTLARNPENYIRIPPCRGCGSRHYRVDRYRERVETGIGGKHRRCNCLGYSFPHAKGRGWCEHNDKLTADLLQARWSGGHGRYA